MSSGQTPLLKQGHLDPIAQNCVQMASEYVQEWRLHSFSGQPVPVLSHPHGEKMFPEIQRDPPVFQCVLTASGPAAGHH